MLKKNDEKWFKMIKNVEENINSEIFKKYFRYQNPSILEKDLFIANQVKNDQIGN